jgi:transposase
MGKHATKAQKVEFLTHCEYVTCAKAARKVGLSPSTAKDILKKVGKLCVEKAEQGLPSPCLAEQVARKPGSGAPSKISEEKVTRLLESCTLNKKQRALWQTFHRTKYELW